MTGLSALIMQEQAVAWDVRGIWITAHRGLLGWILLGLIAGWLAGKIARAGIWVHRGYIAGADRVRDRGMDFHEAGDCA